MGINSFPLTMSSSEEPPLPLKLLSLDGGGIRGLSELLMIKEIMHRLMLEENTKRESDGRPLLTRLPKPCEVFDLIGGTSTGGIIALMLGRLRMDIDTAITYYNNMANQVFSAPKHWPGSGRFKATKLEEIIKSAVADVTGDPEESLLEIGNASVCRTFVCARNALTINANIPVLFKTYPSRETHSGCKIWEAARATSAAPTFFKGIEIGRAQPFIDGGLGRNNPSRAVLDEANILFRDRPIGCLVSIGTGQAGIIGIKKPGFLQQVLPTDVIKALSAISTDCEATHEDMLRLFANSPNTYFRLNVEQGMQEIKLSEWKKLANVEAYTMHYMKRKEVDEKLALVVNAIKFPSTLLTIKQLFSSRSSHLPSGHLRDPKICPLPVPHFRGRREILDKMCQYFDSGHASQHVFVLHGLGGSGKSQIAFKFLEDSQANQRFSDIFYIDATNQQTLEADLTAITSIYIGQSVNAYQHWLVNQPRKNWLLFFDNADDVQLDLPSFFPNCRFGNILITTRNPHLSIHAGEGGDAKVTDMDPQDAKYLLLSMSRSEKTDNNEKLAELIVKKLYYFPLAVSQAAAFIHRCSSLEKYLELYQIHRDKLFEELQGQEQVAVYTTWKLSYDQLGLSARTLLQLCSMLHHEGITEDIFERASLSQKQLDDLNLQIQVNELLIHLGKQDSTWNSLIFQQVIGEIRSYSLLEFDSKNQSYSIHPLVQHWSISALGEDRDQMQKCIVSIIGLSLSWQSGIEDYKYQQRVLKHITSSKGAQIQDIDLSVAEDIALVYTEQGQLKKAEALQTVVMEKKKYQLGEKHSDTLSSMANLAYTYRKQGKWKEAELLWVLVMEKRKHLLGEEHHDTLKSMENLASTYRKQGKWKEAEALQIVVMKKKKYLLGKEHLGTLTSMAKLARIYKNQGKWKEAEALEVLVMEKRNNLLGEEHSDTLTSMENLATTYQKQGKWKEAEVLQMVVMEKSKHLLGEEHPDTLIAMGNLASTYQKQGKWKNAGALQIVVMEKSKHLLGDEHPDTLIAMANLALTHRNHGKWKEAEALQVLVMEKSRHLLGGAHPDTLKSMKDLAGTYRHQGQFKKAEDLEKVVMEKSKHLLGEDHPDTLTAMGNCALTYWSQGKWKEAEALQIVVMEKRKHLLGGAHPDTLKSMKDLAGTYRNQGQFKEAEALEEVVMEKSKQLLGEEHPDTLTVMGNLASTYRNQGKWKEAEGLEVLVMEKRKDLLGEEHPDTLTAMANLALTYWGQSKWKEAEALQVVVMEKRKDLLGEEHPYTLKSIKDLAETRANSKEQMSL